MDRWMDKDVVYIMYTVEYYSAVNKECNNVICSDLDGPRDNHTKWSKSDRQRQISW